MIKHVVLMKFREGYSADILQNLIETLNRMPGEITQIVSCAHGKTLGVMPGFDYGMVADFASRDDLMAYLAHPLHLEAGELSRQILENAAPMQFEYS